jgi:heterodisulfide reductase subunit C
MIKQIVFALVLLTGFGVLFWTFRRVFAYFKWTKSQALSDWEERIKLTLKVALGQSKIFRFPIAGMLHAIVFWGFIIILFGSLEMMVDGLFGIEKSLSFLGYLYDFLMAFGDIFAFLIAAAIFIMIIRRLFIGIKRFNGVEMQHKSHYDAIIALLIIFLLMISLLGMNIFYLLLEPSHYYGAYPVSSYLANLLQGNTNAHFWYEFSWWFHIILILIFANVLPYSKHFHVFMSVPSVMVSRLTPLAYIDNMPDITKEVKLMMDPNATFEEAEEEEISRFGAKDIEDLTWVNYLNSLACTECGRCTSVCPANLTGKLLSPRKIMMDTRARMKEKGPGLLKEGAAYDDGKALLRNYISEEELWACTLCNACAQECPININHPSIIIQLRRYLVMEEAAAPAELNTVFSNIENNAAPWQYAQDDRMNWAEELQRNDIS